MRGRSGGAIKDAQFHRIRRLPPYVFSEVNAMKAVARAAGDDIIDFGMGNPDGATPQLIVDKLIETVRNPRTHRYSTSRGIPGLRRAQRLTTSGASASPSIPKARSW
jgi:alanine-synthesizing transaminase